MSHIYFLQHHEHIWSTQLDKQLYMDYGNKETTFYTIFTDLAETESGIWWDYCMTIEATGYILNCWTSFFRGMKKFGYFTRFLCGHKNQHVHKNIIRQHQLKGVAFVLHYGPPLTAVCTTWVTLYFHYSFLGNSPPPDNNKTCWKLHHIYRKPQWMKYITGRKLFSSENIFKVLIKWNFNFCLMPNTPLTHTTIYYLTKSPSFFL